jgi:hypothetical protein
MTIHFTIPGHPVGYTRTTQNTLWEPRYLRYTAYKNAVIAAFLDQVPGEWGHPKPLTTTKDSQTHITYMIYFQNGKHADVDNVAKGIQDALFKCDKYCSQSTSFDYDPINPRVEVTLI